MQNSNSVTMATISNVERKNLGSRLGVIRLMCAVLIGLVVSAAGGLQASAAVRSAVHVGTRDASSVKPVPAPTHTVWQAGEATVTGSIAPGTRLRVHAVLNQACTVGHFTEATCRPQSLLGWETITEDGIFSPVPAPVAPYGVCLGDTVVVASGHTRVLSRQLFACFTLKTAP